MTSQNKEVHQVPVLHVRGSHYEIGFSIGRTFRTLIQDFLDGWEYVREVLLPLYESPAGRHIYETSLKLCQARFPRYVQELQGISDGSKIPFENLFLLHIDTLIDNKENVSEITRKYKYDDEDGSIGCTDILCNTDDLLLGHNEDALAHMKNNFFIVSAQVVEDGEVVEDFSTLTYPGYLPGYTMGYNVHGLLHSVNTIRPLRTFPGRSPVQFITRALLAARTTEECIKIVKDAGVGISDGFNLNLISLADNESIPTFLNIEIGPNQKDGDESEISILEIKSGSSLVHCNKYLRLGIDHNSGQSSGRRHTAIESLPPPNNLEHLKDALSNRKDRDFSVFRIPCEGIGDGIRVATVCVGLFDVKKRTWSIYTEQPNLSKPTAVLPLKLRF